MLAASEKTISMMRASPYQNTANAGLFLKALGSRNTALPRLLQANLGDQVADPEGARASGRVRGFRAAFRRKTSWNRSRRCLWGPA